MTEANPSHDSRASPPFDPPEYKISYGPDQVLQWDPSSNSRALAVALSWHFPVEKTLESKMQAAIRVFLKEEQKASLSTDSGSSPEAISNSVSRESEGSETFQPTLKVSDGLNKRPLPGPESAFQVLNWDPDVKGFKSKRQRRKYEKDEGVKVKANRGNACEEHRRRKVKCDPDSCPYNKQREKAESIVSRDSEKPSDNLPNSSVGSETTSPVEDEKPNPIETKMIAQSTFGPSVVSTTGDSIHTYQDDEFSWQPEPKTEANCHSWIGFHPLTPPSTDFNVSPTQYLQNMHQNESQDPNHAPLPFNVQQDDFLMGFNPSARQDFDDWWLLDYIQTNENTIQFVQSEGNNDQDFYNQLITPTDLPGPNEAHLPDSFLLESAKFDFQPQLQQPLSSLEDSTGLQGFQEPNRLELPSPNYISLEQLNENLHSFEAPSDQLSGLSVPFLYVSDREADAEPNDYVQAEDIVTSLPAAFDPTRTDIMESRKNRDILSIHTQNNIADSQDNPEGVSSNEMLRLHSPIWMQPRTPTEADVSIPELWETGETKGSAGYSTLSMTDIQKYWPHGPTSDERKALGLPEIQGAAAGYYAVPPIDFNEQITAPSITASTSSARRGNSGKIRKVAGALAAFSNRRSTTPPGHFVGSSSRSLELEVDYPEIAGEELRVGTLPQITEQHKQHQDADRNVTPVPRRYRESRTATFASSGFSGLGVLAGSIGDGPQQRRDTLEVPPPLSRRPSSTRSSGSRPNYLQLQHPPSSADEIRGLGLTVEDEAVLAKLPEPIAREVPSASEKHADDKKMASLVKSSHSDQITQGQGCDNDVGELDYEKTQVIASINLVEMDGHQVHNATADDSAIQFNGNVGRPDVAPGKNLYISPTAKKDSIQVNGNTSQAAFAALVESRARRLEAKSSNTDLAHEQVDEVHGEFNLSSVGSVIEADMEEFGESSNAEVKLPDSIIQDRESAEPGIGAVPPTTLEVARGTNLEDDCTIQRTPTSLTQNVKETDLTLLHILTGGRLKPAFPSDTPGDPAKSEPTLSAPISVSSQEVPSDDLEIQELFTPNYRFQYAKVSSMMAESETEAEEREADEEMKMKIAGKSWGDRRLPLKEAIRSVEEGNYILPDLQPQPQSPHQKDDTFDRSRHDPILPVMVERSDSGRIYSKGKRKGFPLAMEERRDSEPVNAGNKVGERKANRKRAQEQKTQYCELCVWVLCLPCGVVEVVGKYGREGVKMVRGWIRGLKKGKKETG